MMNKNKLNEKKEPTPRKPHSLSLNRNDINVNILNIKEPKYNTVVLNSCKMEYDSNDSDEESKSQDLNNNKITSSSHSASLMHSSTLSLNIRTVSNQTRSKERNTSISSLMNQKDPNYINFLKFDPFDRTISRLSGKFSYYYFILGVHLNQMIEFN